MARYAAIDVGTNTVLLVVAERTPAGFTPVAERGEITRLGKGVDASRRLAPEAMARTLDAVARYAAEARSLGAVELAVTATSAARDAANGAEFLAAARERAGVEIEILSGDEEARRSYLAVATDFAAQAGPRPLVAIDIGGGSTEFIIGHGHSVEFHTSIDVGSVRLTERCIRSDPPSPDDFARLDTELGRALGPVPHPGSDALVVGVAGTLTTLYAVTHAIDPYDAARVHGSWMSRQDVARTRQRLAALPLAQRKLVPGLQPERADVIVAGAVLLERALAHLGAGGTRVSDRGLRWGTLAARFGGTDG
jgi:exopolyphosphatase / guanosine-5'-triphosphate,3'-diphosphate pyrophosphatase